MYKKIFIILFLVFGMFFIQNIEVKALDTSYGIEYRLDNNDDCGGLFDKEVIDFLQQIFNVMKYAAPILCLVLSIFDFVKAVASQKDDALQKAAKTTGKRIVFAIILFFIPDLINFLFNLLGWYGTCGIG